MKVISSKLVECGAVAAIREVVIEASVEEKRLLAKSLKVVNSYQKLAKKELKMDKGNKPDWKMFEFFNDNGNIKVVVKDGACG
ncbi:MAG: hypothetical protein AABY32_01090 [Nanoarchaeota archaeon]